ncbi:hypothetical protein SNEBB_008582 [Seison nebaliae]|nr:hypothetical protein SNEBB_008582 [Seison nebaliae]
MGEIGRKCKCCHTNIDETNRVNYEYEKELINEILSFDNDPIVSNGMVANDELVAALYNFHTDLFPNIDFGKKPEVFYPRDPIFDRSLFIFSRKNLLRRFAIDLIEWPPFEYFILITIVVNCFTLALNDRLANKDENMISQTMFKIIATGFIVGKNTYMRNIWNIADFIVVFTGILTLFLTVGSIDLRILRAIRVLRPLKLVSGIPSLQVVLKSILQAMVPLASILLLVLCAILIFAIIGLELYIGVFHSTCYKNNTNYLLFDSYSDAYPCTTGNNPTALHCDKHFDDSSAVCLKQWESGPRNGIVSFDNILLAMLTVFQCVTMEGWTEVLYLTDDAVGYYYNWLYFITLIIIGSFFLLNLVLGVISGEFAREKEIVENRREFLRIKRRRYWDGQTQGYLQWIETGENSFIKSPAIPPTVRYRVVRNQKRIRQLLHSSAENDDEKSDSKVRKAVLASEASLEDKKEYFEEINKEKKFSCSKFIWKSRLKTRKFVKSQFFYWIVIILVFINTLCISCEHYGQPEWLTKFLFWVSIIFPILFSLEMFLKMYALGFNGYFGSLFNRFDFFVVVASAVEILLPEASYGASVLRCLRLLRIFKVTRYWHALHNLFDSLISSIRSIVSLLVLLFLFIVIFALLGMQIFGGKMNFPYGRPSIHFDEFSIALLTVFQVITGDDWNEVMYNGIKSQMVDPLNGNGPWTAYLSSIYFFILVMLGNYALLNVFLAIAVDNLTNAEAMTEAEEELAKEQKEKEEKNLENAQKRITKSHKEKSVSKQRLSSINEGESEIEDESCFEMEEMSSTTAVGENQRKSKKKIFKKFKRKKKRKSTDADDEIINVPYTSFFCLSTTNPIRRFCHHTISLHHFETFILAVIIASTIALAIEDPLSAPNSFKNTVLNHFDYAFTSIFTLELLLKMIDQGLILHPNSYLRSLWNIIDFVVVVLSLVYFILRSQNFSNLNTMKSLRVFRVLRPLKTIKRIPKLKSVFDALIGSFGSVINFLIVYCIFTLIFSVVAVQLFSGKFFYCTDISKMTKDECQGTFLNYDDTQNFDNLIPTVTKREWILHDFNFNSVPNAFLSLFIVQTGEGWGDIIKNSLDSTKVDHGPIEKYSKWTAIYYVIFFVIFPFFFVNIFIALIILAFQRQGEKQENELLKRLCEDIQDEMTSVNDTIWRPTIILLDKNEKSCIDFAIAATPIKGYAPLHRSFRYRIWKFVMSEVFDIIILTVIVLNTIVFCMKVRNFLLNTNWTFKSLRKY